MAELSSIWTLSSEGKEKPILEAKLEVNDQGSAAPDDWNSDIHVTYRSRERFFLPSQTRL
jgi:hypothetical protein